MKRLLTRFWSSSRARTVAGALLGAAGGATYSLTIGCATGSCPLTSNPFIAGVFGAILGASLLAPGHQTPRPAPTASSSSGSDRVA